MDTIERIAATDKTLAALRLGWEQAAEDKKGEWMDKINAELDVRIELMKERDK